MSEDQFISKQAAMDLANELQISVEGYHLYNQAINNYCAEIGSLPEAIVRCKDCKHYQFADNRAFGMPVKMCEWFGFEDVDDDDYCSNAERRQDDY